MTTTLRKRSYNNFILPDPIYRDVESIDNKNSYIKTLHEITYRVNDMRYVVSVLEKVGNYTDFDGELKTAYIHALFINGAVDFIEKIPASNNHFVISRFVRFLGNYLKNYNLIDDPRINVYVFSRAIDYIRHEVPFIPTKLHDWCMDTNAFCELVQNIIDSQWIPEKHLYISAISCLFGGKNISSIVLQNLLCTKMHHETTWQMIATINGDNKSDFPHCLETLRDEYSVIRKYMESCRGMIGKKQRQVAIHFLAENGIRAISDSLILSIIMGDDKRVDRYINHDACQPLSKHRGYLLLEEIFSTLDRVINPKLNIIYDHFCLNRPKTRAEWTLYTSLGGKIDLTEWIKCYAQVHIIDKPDNLPTLIVESNDL